MLKPGNFRILAKGWPKDVIRQSGICIGYGQTPVDDTHWLIGKYAHLQSLLKIHCIDTIGEVEMVPTFKHSGISNA